MYREESKRIDKFAYFFSLNKNTLSSSYKYSFTKYKNC